MKEHTQPSLRFADAQLKTGVRLRYAEQGNPTGHPVILLHGYSDSWFSFSRVLPLLGADYRAYALDVRGHGDSERPANGYTLRELAADVIAFMDAKAIAKAAVIGHSMGSLIAQQVAVAAPQRVTHLVLMGTATTGRNIAGISDLQREVEALIDPVPEKFAREFQDSTIYQPLPDEFLDRAVAESLKLPAHVWRGIMAGMLATDPAAELGKSRIPTLILWGDQDRYFLRSEQDAMMKLIPGAVLKVYPETGHALHWERPEQFAQDLKEFIGRTEQQ
jgi:pimeloyl-ACP methyl ester carboxylesterase